MATLFIVRHAQASFLAENYDLLSPIGEAQSRLLGQYWSTRNLRFDRVCAGPRVRHRDTVKFVHAAYEAAGLDFPEVQAIPEFDEYLAEAVMKFGLPILLDLDARVRDLHAAFLQSAEPKERRATFQRLFEVVVAKWAHGELQLEGIETWQEFCSRVNAGLNQFLSAGGTAAIFTSGGPTAVALQRALDLSPQRTLEASWMVRNSSWSEFLYSAKRFTLSSFNVHEHVTDPAHLTYR
jgi:broad specificity phosphatase PhoE